MADQTDVAIVGGGAAGIAAARRLAALGHRTMIVEALPRLGGRGHTIDAAGWPIDLGCGWLHSARRNPLVQEAERRGLAMRHGKGAWSDLPPPELAHLQDPSEAWAAYARLTERLHGDPPASDRAGDAMATDDPWRPFADALSTYINGVELDRLSVADFLAYDDAAGASNWRLPGGYGAFLVALGADMPRALDTRVTSITQGDDVVLETDGGAIHARAAIVTVSTTVLAAGAIRFGPDAADHLHAAAGLPLGLADKVFLAVPDAKSLPPEAHVMGRLDRAATGSYYLRPLGRPMIECFLGGAHARALESDADAVAFVREELAGLFGADFARGLAPLAVTAWAREPTIGGSYSHALPGRADARGVLARPVNERLCFAGEACSPQDFSTAHGAWESGVAAADWIARGLPQPAARRRAP